MGKYTVTVIEPDGTSFHVFCDNGVDCEEVVQSEGRRSRPMTLILMSRIGSGGGTVTVDRWAVEKSGRLVRARRSKRAL